IGVIFLCFTGLCLFVFSNFLAGLFTNDAQVQELASNMLKIVSFAQPLFAASIVLSGALRGAGDTKWPFAISLICMWGVLPAVWIAMVCDLNMKGILCIIRFRTGKWYKKELT
ncbi:MAG: MATE family efflux transporter, partial [Oscillospiraceae bacterium]